MITRYSLKHSAEPVPEPKTGDKINQNGVDWYINNPLFQGLTNQLILVVDGLINFSHSTEKFTDWWMAKAKTYMCSGSSDQRFSTPPKGCVITLTQE